MLRQMQPPCLPFSAQSHIDLAVRFPPATAQLSPATSSLHDFELADSHIATLSWLSAPIAAISVRFTFSPVPASASYWNKNGALPASMPRSSHCPSHVA